MVVPAILTYVELLPKQDAYGTDVYKGLQRICKIYAHSGIGAFYITSDLDLDTDGKASKGVHYEGTHQGRTSIDGDAEWLDSNLLNFIVIPLGFTKKHGGVELGTLCTVVYKDRVAHGIVADFGPSDKIGEGSIHLHRELGFERIKDNGHIIDVNIERDVFTLIYINQKCSVARPSQDQINKEASLLFDKFRSRV